LACTWISCNFNSQGATISIYNDSEFSISQVYTADSGTEAWGNSRLTALILPGETGTIAGIERDIVDIKIVFDTSGQITVVETHDFTFTTHLTMEVRIPSDG